MESRNRSSILVKRKESEVSSINCLSFGILKHKRFILFAVVMHDSSSYVLNVDMKYPRTARPRRCLFTKSPSAASWSWDVICPWSPPLRLWPLELLRHHMIQILTISRFSRYHCGQHVTNCHTGAGLVILWQ